ncbi:MAG: hypothetical protein ACYCY5_12660 [Sulfuricella sp.]
MVKIYIVLIVCILFSSISSAAFDEGAEIPILGYVRGEYLYVPTYVSKHRTVPQRVYAYYEKGEIVGTLRGKNSLIGPEERTNTEAPYTGYSGRFVYRIESERVSSEYLQVIIFRHRKHLKYENGVFSDRHSNIVWRIVTLTSSEGYHDYLQTIKDGKCINYIDYYYNVPYDTESDGIEAFIAARCGQEINPIKAHP